MTNEINELKALTEKEYTESNYTFSNFNMTLINKISYVLSNQILTKKIKS
jgi:hypothetical protein